MTILTCTGLTKRYLTSHAITDVNLSVEGGQVVGILGPNGSGKTTLLKLVAGLLHPDAGIITANGAATPSSLHRHVAFLPDRPQVYPWMTVSSACRWFADLFPDFDVRSFTNLMEQLGLPAAAKVTSLSKGSTEKLGLALTLARQAPLTVLDEPLSGVDPVARDEILRAMVSGMRPDAAMLIASHLVGELEPLLDTAVLLDAGRLVQSVGVEGLRAERGLTLDRLYREVFNS